MKHFLLKTWLTMLCLLVGVGASWAEDVVYKTAQFSKSSFSKGVQNYTSTFTSTTDGFTVELTNFNNNNSGWDFVKTGNRTASSQGSIATVQPIDKAITKIAITIDEITESKVSSICVQYGATPGAKTYTEHFTIANGVQSVNITTPSANKYYSIIFECQKGSSNGIVQVSKIDFYVEGNTTPSKTLSSISVKTPPTKVTYTEGENFNPSGLVITQTFSDSNTEDVTYSSTNASAFSFNPSLTTALETSNTSVAITYGGKSTSQAITVDAIPYHTASFSVNGTTSSTTVKEGASITFPADPADINGKKFMGWAENTIVGTTNTAPTFITSATMGNADKIYYAVFATAQGSAESIIETVGFESSEGYTAGTTYNSSSYTTGSTGSKWKINYGAFATSGAIVGSQSAQFRIYSSGGGYGQLSNTVAYTNDISKVVFTAKTANTNGKVKISYSTNGTSWTDISTQSLTTSAAEYTITVPVSGVKYIKFTAAGTKPTSGNYSVYVDAVKIYTGGGLNYSDYCTTVDNTPAIIYNVSIDPNISNGSVEADPSVAEEGTTINLTATPADGYELTSWSVTNANSESITVTDNQFTMPASDVIVSATFSEVQTGGGDEQDGDYVLTAIDQIEQEDEVVIVFTNSTASYAMSNANGTTSAPSAVKVTIANNTIAAPADNILWNVSYSDGTFVIYPKGSNNKWLYCTNDNNGVRVGAGNAKDFTIKNGYLYETGTTDARYLGVYNNADVRSYTSINSNISGQTLAFYVKKAAPKVLASIAISGTYKTEFFQNDEFSHDGIVVTATYEDESTKDVTAKSTFSELDMTTTGTKTVTVTYTEGEITKTETYDINVAEEVLTSISLGGNYTTNFEQNGTFNHDGLTVTAHYNSGRTADVTAEVTVSTPDMSTLGDQPVTVSYGGKEATYTIKVAGYYIVTIDNTNDTHGTISVWNGDVELASGAQVLDGTKLTIKCTPTDGYKYKNWQYKAKGDWTTKYTNFEYTIDGSNVSFRANFEKIPEYSITYYVNGVPTTETLREGEALHFPESPTMAGKVFRGWIDKVKVDDSSVKPTFVTATKAQGNATFFAVFATETTTEGTTGSNVWEKVPHDFNAANLSKTDETKYADWIADGNQYLIVYEASSTQGYVFNGTGDDKDYKTVTITDGKIADDASFVYITMDKVNTNHISFTVNGSANDGKMMGDKKGGNGMNFYNFSELLTVSDRAYANNDISTNNYSSYNGPYSGQWSIKSHGAYLRFYTSSGSNYFRYYTTETTGNPVEFYVKKAATETTTEYSDFTTNMDVIERTAVQDKYFTICYPYAVHPKAYPGATAYNIVGKTMSGDRIATLELEEVADNAYLEAGHPYFMVGDDTNFLGYHSLDNPAAEAGNHNGLYGVFPKDKNLPLDAKENGFAFSEIENFVANEYYVISSNKVQAGTQKSGVKAYRAYIKKSEIHEVSNQSAARFVIELEEGTLTELDEVELKPIVTSIYNLQGQRINRTDKGVYIVNGRKVIR